MTRDEEIVVFHYVLGVAIANWSSVENMLRKILVSGFKNETLNREALSVGFFTMEGFWTKLKFADAVVSRKLAPSKAHHDDWKELSEAARQLSQNRNKLAHWGSAKYWHRRPGLRIVLAPWVHKKTTKDRKPKHPQPPAGSLNIRDIYKLSLSFLAFAAALDNFYHRLVGQPEPHAASSLQAQSPPTAEALAKEIRGVFAVRPQSLEAKPR